MRRSESIDILSAALSKLHGIIGNAPVDSKNPHFKNDYASLESVINISRKLLSECELSIVQSPNVKEDKFVLTTLLSHKSGQWIESDCPLFVENNKMQSLGSAISYARRYVWSSFLGISQTDNDCSDSVQSVQPTPIKQAPKPIAAATAKALETVLPKALAATKKSIADIKKDIWATLTVEYKMSESDAIEWLKMVSKKANSTEWNDEDIAKIYKAIAAWKPE